MKGREAQSQLGKTGAYGETDLAVALLGSHLLDVASSKTRSSPLSPMCRRTHYSSGRRTPHTDDPHRPQDVPSLLRQSTPQPQPQLQPQPQPQPQRRPPNHQTEVAETVLFPHRVLAPSPSPQTSPSQRAHHRCHPRTTTHNRSDGPHTPTTHIALQMCCHCCGNPPLASIVCSSNPTTTGAPPRLPDRDHKGHALSSSRIASSFLLSDVAPSTRSSSFPPVCSHTHNHGLFHSTRNENK